MLKTDHRAGRGRLDRRHGRGAIAALSVKRVSCPTTDESADEIVAVAIFGPLELPQHARELPWRPVSSAGTAAASSTCATRRSRPKARRSSVRAVFGGGQILVPADWKVVSTVSGHGRPAGHPRRRRAMPADAPELVIEGVLIAGGFAVSSEIDHGADWEADLQALRDNDELKLEADTTPVS